MQRLFKACFFPSNPKNRHNGTEMVLFELTGLDELIIVTNQHFCETFIQFVSSSFQFFLPTYDNNTKPYITTILFMPECFTKTTTGENCIFHRRYQSTPNKFRAQVRRVTLPSCLQVFFSMLKPRVLLFFFSFLKR